MVSSRLVLGPRYTLAYPRLLSLSVRTRTGCTDHFDRAALNSVKHPDSSRMGDSWCKRHDAEDKVRELLSKRLIRHSLSL